MTKQSAGILLFRTISKDTEVLLVHPGGPFFIKKDLGSWSIPKGEFDSGEEPLHAAIREMNEETGIELSGDFIELPQIRQKSGKLVFAWALEKDVDTAGILSNTFEIEWPPRSGRKQSFPEIDKAAWFTIDEARQKILAAQMGFLESLSNIIQGSPPVD